MAPTKKTTDVTIDQITKDDFLNNCCPMRTGSRCRNKSACALKIERINQSTLQNAEFPRPDFAADCIAQAHETYSH
jgi:hypothetical protein